MRIYFFVAFLSLAYLPFTKLSLFQTDYVNIIHTNDKQIKCEVLADQDANHYLTNFILLGDVNLDKILDIASTENSFPNNYFYWGVGTDSIRSRVKNLRRQSALFDNLLEKLEEAEYPLYILVDNLENATGSFSSLQGELRFSMDKMDGFLFDATIIEEFIHAYQAEFYGYAHGNCLKRDFQFAQLYGDAIDQVKLEKRTGNWERYGRKHAYIESEAKVICYLIQNQCNSIPLQHIVDTDEYNAGGKARAIIFSHIKARNCLALKRLDRLVGVEDYYVDYDVFMKYQHAFIKHWKKFYPNCIYTKGRFRHRPEALQALVQ